MEFNYRKPTHHVFSQTQQVLDWLDSGMSLTPLEALQRFGTLRLAALIHTLRDEGHQIVTERVELPNGKRVARYYKIK
jgi:hypothetical protein